MEIEYLPDISRPVCKKKYDNIQELMKYVPIYYHPFYRKISFKESSDIDSDTDISDDG